MWDIIINSYECPNLGKDKSCNRKYDVNRPKVCSEHACPIKHYVKLCDMD